MSQRLFIALGLLFSLLMGHSLLWTSGFNRMHGDEGDTRFVHYSMEYSYRWLVRMDGAQSLWNAPFYHPTPNVTAMSDVMLGSVFPYAMARVAGVPPEGALVFWVLVSSTLNFLAMYCVLRNALKASLGGSVTGAILFTVGSSRINQLNHLQLLGHFWPLFAFLFVYKAIQSEKSLHRALWFCTASLCWVLQLYTSFYWGWFVGFLCLVAILYFLADRNRRKTLSNLVNRHRLELVMAAGVFAFLIAPLATHYLAMAKTVGLRTFSGMTGMLPRLQSWFYLGNTSWLYGSSAGMFRIPVEGEQRLGMGLITTLVLILVFWKRRHSPGIRAVAFVALLTILMVSMYRFQFSPWKFFFHAIPGASAIRAVSRFGVWLLIPAGMALALAWDELKMKRGRRYAMLLSAACILEQGQTQTGFLLDDSRRDIEALKGSLSSSCASFYYSPDHPRSPGWKYQIDAMWAGLESNLPTVNGYSGSEPPHWNFGNGDTNAAVEAWVTQTGLNSPPCIIRYKPLR